MSRLSTELSYSGSSLNLESAAHEAALADGLITSSSNNGPAPDVGAGKLKKIGLRRGKWTTEEEYYANRLIYEFKLGLLPLTDGTTLRTFLSKLLNCDPMRISKKFVGQNCIGKQVFRRRQQDLDKLTTEQIELSRNELAELERKFLERVAQCNRTKSGSIVKSVKDGRVSYEDGGEGSSTMVPWMIPPDDASGESQKSAFATHSLYDTSLYGKTRREEPSNDNEPKNDRRKDTHRGVTPSHTVSQVQHVPYGVEHEGLFQRVSSLDILCSINTNPTPNSNPSQNGEYYPGFNNGANTIRSNQSYTWNAAGSDLGMPSLGADLGMGHKSTSFGTIMDWPSMNSLVNASETVAEAESKDNISRGNNSQGFQTGATNQMESHSNGNNSQGFRMGATNQMESHSNGTVKLEQYAGINHSHARGGNTQNGSNEADNHGDSSSSTRNTATTSSNNQVCNQSNNINNHHNGLCSNVLSTHKRKNPAHSLMKDVESPIGMGMPRNSSVNDFWMLVETGDLPHPDHDVLSETLWQNQGQVIVTSQHQQSIIIKDMKPMLNGSVAQYVESSYHTTSHSLNTIQQHHPQHQHQLHYQHQHTQQQMQQQQYQQQQQRLAPSHQQQLMIKTESKYECANHNGHNGHNGNNGSDHHSMPNTVTPYNGNHNTNLGPDVVIHGVDMGIDTITACNDNGAYNGYGNQKHQCDDDMVAKKKKTSWGTEAL